jgi:heat shock protein HslJ
MRTKMILIFGVLFALLLTACGSSTPTAAPIAAPTNTSVPVEAPTVTTVPTEEPVPTEVETADPAALSANDWQWVSFTNPVEQFEIDMPENYQLIFFDDGTFQIVADCNNACGAFVDEDGALTIEMFQSTLALCPGVSRSEQFFQLLVSAEQLHG